MHAGAMRARGTPSRPHQGGGGAPGRRHHSRSPPMVAGHCGVDAAADCSPRRPPASVGRRTGAPPPPCRHDVGMLTLRGQTTLNREASSLHKIRRLKANLQVERPAKSLPHRRATVGRDIGSRFSAGRVGCDGRRGEQRRRFGAVRSPCGSGSLGAPRTHITQ